MTMTGAAAGLVDRYRVEIARGVDGIDPAEWNSVVLDGGGSVFHTWEWLAAFEDAPPGRFDAAHLLAYDDERLVGVCPAYLVHSCPRLDHLAGLAGIRFDGPVLLAHSLAAFAGGPLGLPGHEGVVEALTTGLERAAGELGAWASGFANLPAGPLTGRLLGSGYAVARISTAYELANDFVSTDDYWNSFRSRTRRELGRERRLFERSGSSVVTHIPDEDTFVGLVQALLVDHGTPCEVLPENFLRALHHRLAPYDRTVATVDETGEVAALFAIYEFGGHRSMWLAGLDVSRYGSFGSYRPMLSAAIEGAISEGTHLMNLGRGNAAPKRRFGATAVPLHLALTSADRRRTARLHLVCAELESRARSGTDGLDVVSRCC